MAKANNTNNYNMVVIQNAPQHPLLEWISLKMPVKIKKSKRIFSFRIINIQR